MEYKINDNPLIINSYAKDDKIACILSCNPSCLPDNNVQIYLVIDCSGSMGDVINSVQIEQNTNIFQNSLFSNANNTKSNIVSSSVNKCVKMLKDINKGKCNIELSIITFSNTAECVLKSTFVNNTLEEYINTHINTWCLPKNNTNIGAGICIANLEMENSKKDGYSQVAILLSDGDITSGDDASLLCQKYPKFFNSCIGFGPCENYNKSLFDTLSYNTYGVPDCDKLCDYFMMITFGATAEIANNININITGCDNIKSLLTFEQTCKDANDEKNNLNMVSNISTFYLHTSVIIIFNVKHENTIKLKYTSSNSNITEIYSNLLNERENIVNYCELYIDACITMNNLSNIDTTCKKNKLNEILILINKSHLERCENDIVKNCLNSIKIQCDELLKSLRSFGENEFNNLLNQTNSCNRQFSVTPLLVRQKSESYARQVSSTCGDETQSLCYICCSNKRTIVFKLCSHLVACNICIPQMFNENLYNCPICRVKPVYIRDIKINDIYKCIICKNRTINIYIEPCNHACICFGCTNSMLNINPSVKCPICNILFTENDIHLLIV